MGTPQTPAGGATPCTPLHGIRVLDLSRVLAGPYCTMLLGDLGADVVKVELPGVGDDTRRWGPPFVAGESAYYLGVNRNKRSLTLNLKHPRGREILCRLAKRSDVLVENFKRGTLESMELGYEQLRALNPRLVYCAISGFGNRGPRANQAGYDFAIQAIGGLMSITGEPDGEPMKVGVAVVDVTAGLYALGGILAALRARDRDGIGQRIDVSLFQAQLAWLVNVGSSYLLTGEEPKRYGNAHASIVPYQTFPCRDGWIVIGAGNDGQFRALCRVLGREPLADDLRFADNPSRVANRDALIPILNDLTGDWTMDALLAELEAAAIPCAPINTLDRVFADPQVDALGAVVHAQHPTIGGVPMVRWPFDLSGTPAELRRPPPLLGEHTAELLGELGLTPGEVDALAAQGAI